MPYWPALILGILLVAYWGRVLRLVYKIRRKTGRDANFAPSEPLGMVLRIVWYPVATVWIVHPLLSAFPQQITLPAVMRPLFLSAAVGYGAALVGIGAFAATLVCWKRMGKAWRMGINPDEKTQLVVSGPYAYVRHPIYALSSLLMLATVAAVPSPLMLVAGAIHLLLLQWEASREEKYLKVHHGQVYEEYCRHVGRFTPRSIQPYRQGSGFEVQGSGPEGRS